MIYLPVGELKHAFAGLAKVISGKPGIRCVAILQCVNRIPAGAGRFLAWLATHSWAYLGVFADAVLSIPRH